MAASGFQICAEIYLCPAYNTSPNLIAFKLPINTAISIPEPLRLCMNTVMEMELFMDAIRRACALQSDA